MTKDDTKAQKLNRSKALYDWLESNRSECSSLSIAEATRRFAADTPHTATPGTVRFHVIAMGEDPDTFFSVGSQRGSNSAKGRASSDSWDRDVAICKAVRHLFRQLGEGDSPLLGPLQKIITRRCSQADLLTLERPQEGGADDVG